MATVHLEVLVEPFRENEPGDHVRAVLDQLIEGGLQPDLGPFSTTADGDLDQVAEAVASAISAGIRNGATALQFRIKTTDE